MSDIDQVLTRIETDFDFYLAVHGPTRPRPIQAEQG